MTAIHNNQANGVVLCPNTECDFDSYTLAEMDAHVRTNHTDTAEHIRVWSEPYVGDGDIWHYACALCPKEGFQKGWGENDARQAGKAHYDAKHAQS